MSAVLSPPGTLTRAEYHALGDAGFFGQRRVELIHGVVRDMSPINWPHMASVTRTAECLRVAFAGVGWVCQNQPYPAGDSEPQPDVAVYPGAVGDYTDIPDRALIAVEVSNTTLDFDLTTKAEIYATAGIPDYWVVDLENCVVIVFRDPQPLPHALGAVAYRTRLVFGPADRVSPLAAAGASFAVSELLP